MKLTNFAHILLLLCILSIQPLWAQYQVKIDSLLQELPKLKEDTVKVELYRRLCWNYGGLRTEIAMARAYADSMKLLSEKLNYTHGIIEAHLSYGMVNRYEGNYDEALKELEKYISYHKKHNNPAKEAKGWFQVCTIQQAKGNYEKSLEAAEYCITIYQKNEDWNGVAGTLNSIGIIYKRTGKYQEAIDTYKKALATNDKYQLNRDLTYVYHNIGNAYTELQQYDTALQWYQKSLDMSRVVDNSYAIASNLTTIGRVYNLTNRFVEAIALLSQAVAIREDLPQKRALARSLIELGNAYANSGDDASAEQTLMRGLDLAKEVKTTQLIHDSYKYLTELYTDQRNYERAFKYIQLHHQMQDSIFSEKKIQQINELHTRYETAQKDQQITLLAKENEIQKKETLRQSTMKWAFFIGLILFGIVTGLVFYILRQKLKNHQVIADKDRYIREVSYKQQMSELEMKALRGQINPHFIFNCMNSINQMILEKKDKKASGYLTKLGKLIRLILENVDEPDVSLNDELTMLETYIALESLRFNGKINYNIKIGEDIDLENTYLPAMVLQPFVENAIWHGLMPKKKHSSGLISISIEQERGKLKCLIEDNGIGREKSMELQQKSVFKRKSLGVKITEERLKLVSNEMRQQLIRFIDLKDAMGHALGTRVEVNVPLN